MFLLVHNIYFQFFFSFCNHNSKLYFKMKRKKVSDKAYTGKL